MIMPPVESPHEPLLKIGAIAVFCWFSVPLASAQDYEQPTYSLKIAWIGLERLITLYSFNKLKLALTRSI